MFDENEIENIDDNNLNGTSEEDLNADLSEKELKVNEQEEINDDDSVLYKTICTSQYFQLYDFQHGQSKWKYIRYPNTLRNLEELFEVIGGSIRADPYLYNITAPDPQLPYIIRLFIFLYIAHAAESLLY